MASILVCVGYFNSEDDKRLEMVINGLGNLGKVRLGGNEIYDLYCSRLTTAITKEDMDEGELITWLEAKISSLLGEMGLVFKVGEQLPIS